MSQLCRYWRTTQNPRYFPPICCWLLPWAACEDGRDQKAVLCLFHSQDCLGHWHGLGWGRFLLPALLSWTACPHRWSHYLTNQLMLQMCYPWVVWITAQFPLAPPPPTCTHFNVSNRTQLHSTITRKTTIWPMQPEKRDNHRHHTQNKHQHSSRKGIGT